MEPEASKRIESIESRLKALEEKWDKVFPVGNTEPKNRGLPPDIMEIYRAWEAVGMTSTKRAGQGHYNKRLHVRIRGYIKNYGKRQILDSIENYAHEIKKEIDWKQKAMMFSTFFGPQQRWMEYLVSEEQEERMQHQEKLRSQGIDLESDAAGKFEW